MQFTSETLAAHGYDTKKLSLPQYPDFPDHDLKKSARFEVNTEGQEWLADYYAIASSVLTALQKSKNNTSPLRVWPHHFDIATLVTYSSDDYKNEASIGVGALLGDGGYDEPYFYITPWPYPEKDSLKKLEGEGMWHTEGWVGALLLVSRLKEAEYANAIKGFLNDAFDKAEITLKK